MESPQVIQAEVNVVTLGENEGFGLRLFSLDILPDFAKTGHLCEFKDEE